MPHPTRARVVGVKEEQPDLTHRVERLEAAVVRLDEDAVATRTLAALADRDVSEFRQAMGAQAKVLSALRETQIEHGRALERQQGLLDRQRAELRQQTLVLGQQTQTLERHTDTLDQQTQTLERHTDTLDQHTQTLERHTDTLDQHTQTLERHTDTLDQHTQTLGQQTERLDQHTEKLDSLLTMVGRLVAEH
jgi:ABC-type transporter Mla subunit MlaD